MGTRRLKDPVHGYIKIDADYFEKIIDTKQFQRLRNLKQLSATFMVYPSANHTRFEHSIGVFFLAKRAFNNLSQEERFKNGVDVEEIKKTLLSAALLHDIGHPPFSHIAEPLLEQEELTNRLDELELKQKMRDAGIGNVLTEDDPLESKAKHELLSCVIILEEYSSALEKIGVDPHEVAAYVIGDSIKAAENQGWQHKVASDIISSEMDVDRLDYVTRDNFMTGANLANVDVDRLVSSYETCENSSGDFELTFSENALSTVSNYLEGRLGVYMWVTQHHKSVYANALLRELLRELNRSRDGEIFTVDKVLDEMIDDNYVQAQLQDEGINGENERLSQLYDRFVERDFLSSVWKHKLAYENKVDFHAQGDFEDQIGNNNDELEENIANEIGIDEQYVWIEQSYVPTYNPADLRDIQISYNNKPQPIHEIGLYNDDEYTGPIPYIFTRSGHEEEIVELLNEAFG